MKSFEARALYLEKAGSEATDKVLEFVRKYAERRGVKDLVVASTTGRTGAKASRVFRGYNLVVVSHHHGFQGLGKTELLKKHKLEILRNGGKIHTGTHALSGPERSIRRKFDTLGPLELIAHAYRSFGEGTKVCIEIALMAADAGLIPTNRDTIAIAGTGRGADTALLLRPATSSDFFELKVREVVCKPLDF